MTAPAETLDALGVIPATGRRFDPLIEADLASIEGRLGATLPKAYRELLLKYGAFAFEISVRCPRGGISYFYGKETRSNPALGLEWAMAAFEDVLPRGMMAIAADSCGHQICLVISDELRLPAAPRSTEGAGEVEAPRGSLWFWVRGALRHESFLEIAPSFEQFVESLETYDELD